MKATVSESDKLKRKISVEVPLKDVQAVYAEVYGKLQTNIRVKGFRPGRFPKNLAEKRFESAMAGEAMQTLVPRYYEQALGELDLRPATEPRFDNLEIDKSRPFKFDVEVEIVPPFDLLPPSAFKLKEIKSKVTAQDVDDRIEELRNSRAAYQDKGQEAAGKTDMVLFDFQGTLNGELFDGGSGADQRIEVGSTQYLPEFDAQFHGIKAGEKKSFPLTFPEDYAEASLAGKEVQFEITAKKVEKKVPPPLDKDFFSQFGAHETETEFKEELKGQLETEQANKVQQDYGNDLAEQIRGKYKFDVPETLVEQGLQEFEHQRSHDNPGAPEDEQSLAKLKKEEQVKIIANLRVAYVMDALTRKYDVKAGEEEVKQRFFMQAYMMRMNPTELVENEMGRRMLMQIEQTIVTGKALEQLAGEVLKTPSKSGGKSASAQGAAGKGGGSRSGAGSGTKEAAKAKSKGKGKAAADKAAE